MWSLGYLCCSGKRLPGYRHCHPERAKRVEGSWHEFDCKCHSSAQIPRLHFIPRGMTEGGLSTINENLYFHKLPNPIYFFWHIVYDTPEQSRRPCVKCHRDGELPGGRRNFSTIALPHPLLHMGKPPLCSNDTRSGEWSAVFAALPYGCNIRTHSPCALRTGFFVWSGIRRRFATY